MLLASCPRADRVTERRDSVQGTNSYQRHVPRIRKGWNAMKITHGDIVHFAENKVNLPAERAKSYRKQINHLSDRLEKHLKECPNYHFKRIMLSGSLAKRTSLRNISDADVALYVRSDEAPQEMENFKDWLSTELTKIYGTLNEWQVTKKNFCVTIEFVGSGLEVDVVPVFWKDDKWNGELISQDDGKNLTTNVVYHLEFILKRHKKEPNNFRQIVRLLKYWANEQKEANSEFRFKSFMIELIVAHLMDSDSLTRDNFPEALREFFDYIVIGKLNDVICFDDFGQGSVSGGNSEICIFDPVNAKNNVASLYTKREKDLILSAALDAADAIEYATYATTKAEAVEQWRRVFGTTFAM